MNILRLTLLTYILSFAYSCQPKKQTETSLDYSFSKEFFQRWKLDYGMAENQKIKDLPKSPINDYEFKKDGSYFIYNDDKTYVTGNWKYNDVEKVIYLRHNDGEINSKIVDIKAKSITLIPTGKMVEGTPFEKFRFYYVPSDGS